MNDLNKVEKLTPFGHFCRTIGNLPSSYMESLTFEEQVMWFCNFLENKVIPIVNNNGECVEELQNLYIELKNYVDNYFDNLDVQEEINNKLNGMVEDGTMSTIINQEIFGNINNNINAINNDLNEIKSDIHIFIGDSYSVGTGSETNVGWCERVKNLLNLSDNNYVFNGRGGAGFAKTGNTFLSLLQQVNIENKNYVKKIIVCGGNNDFSYSKDQIIQAIKTFVDYAKNNYPNAKIYIGAIGNNSINAGVRTGISRNVIPGYLLGATLSGASFLEGTHNVLKDYSLICEDGNHPNENGYTILSSCISDAIQSGSTSYYTELSQAISLPTDLGSFNGNIFSRICNDTEYFYVSLGSFSVNSSIDASSGIIDFGVVNLPYYKGVNNTNITFELYADLISNGKPYAEECQLEITPNTNHLRLLINIFKNDGVAGANVLSNITGLRFRKTTKTYPTIEC